MLVIHSKIQTPRHNGPTIAKKLGKLILDNDSVLKDHIGQQVLHLLYPPINILNLHFPFQLWKIFYHLSSYLNKSLQKRLVSTLKGRMRTLFHFFFFFRKQARGPLLVIAAGPQAMVLVICLCMTLSGLLAQRRGGKMTLLHNVKDTSGTNCQGGIHTKGNMVLLSEDSWTMSASDLCSLFCNHTL